MKHFAQHLSGLVLGLGLILSALPKDALDAARVNATVPFDFTVGDTQLKAGDYIIESQLDNQVLMLRSKGGASNKWCCLYRSRYHENHPWKSRILAIFTWR